LSARVVAEEAPFMALLGGVGLAAAVQPIVAVDDRATVAFELLGRSTHPALPQSPVHLFRLAGLFGREVELSEALRAWGATRMAPCLGGRALFVNAHPAETLAPTFLDRIAALRARHPQLDLVVEIHEAAIVDVGRMRGLATRLAELGVRFAYDDFGAGQARLAELADVPAHVVKFDISMVQGIDTAHANRQRVVADLARLVRDVGSIALAEGVETEGEAETCRQMGFSLLQGFLTGRPEMVPPTGIEPVSAA
jgi:EAL domain-containing protein (putative c-di-GMP-specific phosphodiesterase class I)